MKAYLTSIGETTTEIAAQQLDRFGFEVLILRGDQPWIEKYKRFIVSAKQNVSDGCIRVDADFIVNQNVKSTVTCLGSGYLMVAYKGFDFYRNNVGVCGPVFYSAEAIAIIDRNIKKLETKRPETSAWRLDDVVQHTLNKDTVMGMHGFFQTSKDLKRHLDHKKDRHQMEEYDFELAEKLLQNEKTKGGGFIY